MKLTAQQIVNKVIEDRDKENARAIRRLSKRVDKRYPYELDLQILIQYALIK